MATSTYKPSGQDTGLNREEQIANINTGLADLSRMVADSSSARASVNNLNERINEADRTSQDEVEAVSSAKKTSKDAQGEIDRQREALRGRQAAEESLISSLFEETKRGLEQSQKKEFAGRSTGLITSGGYLGTTQSNEGVLANLAQEHRSEIAALTLKKVQAIREAKNSYEDRDFKLADQKIEEARSLDDNIIKIRKQFADDVLARQKESRSEENQTRDDARTTLNSLISNFGGVGLESLSLESRTALGEMADAAGIPRDLIVEGFRTLKEKNMENVQNQREFSQMIGMANLSIRQAALAISQSRETRASSIDALEAERLGLPKSVVGLTQEQINSDLQGPGAPIWFVRAEEEKEGKRIDINELNKRWATFRSDTPGEDDFSNIYSNLPPPIE